MPSRFAHLLSAGRIGSLELRNRIVMSPMGSNLAGADGSVGDTLIRYYEERARGGAGLLVVGVASIAWPRGASIPNQIAISDDAFLPGLRRLTDAAHAHGARIAAQLHHGGKVATRDIVAGRELWVPSETPLGAGDLYADLTPGELDVALGPYQAPGARMALHEMTRDDIAQVAAWFAEAAGRAREAGFDGVEIHAGHGYVLSAFLSPSTNHRTDEYGGSLENRTRFLTETIQAVRAQVGGDMPVWCRLDAKEYRKPDGIREEDARETAVRAVAAGLDALHVSAYADPSSAIAFTEAPLVHEPLAYVPLASAIKERLDVPVIAVGRIEPEEADRLIASGSADFVAMARKLLADPHLPRKLAGGGAVRPCIYSYRCVGNIFLNGPSRCTVNPASGREAEHDLETAAPARRVLVAGGGAAGLEAARIAALRGHRVSLLEASDGLGGLLRRAGRLHPEGGRLADWLESEAKDAGVKIQLGTPATRERILAAAPDVVIWAVGADSTLDELADIVAAPEKLGARVAVIGGGGIGVKLATFLARRGLEVKLVEAETPLAPEVAPPLRWRLLHELRESGVEVTGEDPENVDCDSRVSTLRAPRAHDLGRDFEVHSIGDCEAPGSVETAFEAAGRVARAL